MTTLTIQLERNEFRALKMNASRQLRSPENLARYMILKNMGFVTDEPFVPTKHNTNADSAKSRVGVVETAR